MFNLDGIVAFSWRERSRMFLNGDQIAYRQGVLVPAVRAVEFANKLVLNGALAVEWQQV